MGSIFFISNDPAAVVSIFGILVIASDMVFEKADDSKVSEDGNCRIFSLMFT